MYRKNGFVSKGLVVKSGLALLAAVCVIGLFGCGRRLARLERNQRNLQRIMEKSNVELAQNSAFIRQNQREIKSSIRTTRFSNTSISSKVTAIEEGQAKLQELVTNSDHQTARNINLSRDRIVNNANSNSREIVSDIADSREALSSNVEASREQIINTMTSGGREITRNINLSRDRIVNNANSNSREIVSDITDSREALSSNVKASQEQIINTMTSGSREIVKTLNASNSRLINNITSSKDRIISKAESNRDEIINNTAASSNKIVQSVAAVDESFHRQLAEAQKDDRDITAEVAGLSTSLGKLEVKLTENLSRQLNDIKENQHKLHNGFETLQADFNELSSEVVVVKENQNKLGSNLNDIKENQHKLNNGVETLQDDFNELGSEVVVVKENQNKLQSSLETENQKVRTEIMKALERLNTLISKISSSDETGEGTAVAARND
ncbi:hypothetical protein ACFL1G_01665 [Planctomycetota bacterium]